MATGKKLLWICVNTWHGFQLRAQIDLHRAYHHLTNWSLQGTSVQRDFSVTWPSWPKASWINVITWGNHNNYSLSNAIYIWFTSLNWGHVQLNYPYILNYHFYTLKEIGNLKRVNFFASIGPWPGTSNNLVPPTIAVGLSPSLHMTVPEFVVDPSRHFSNVWTTQNWVEPRRQWLRMAEMFKAHRRRLDMNMRWCKRVWEQDARICNNNRKRNNPSHSKT